MSKMISIVAGVLVFLIVVGIAINKPGRKKKEEIIDYSAFSPSPFSPLTVNIYRSEEWSPGPSNVVVMFPPGPNEPCNIAEDDKIH